MVTALVGQQHALHFAGAAVKDWVWRLLLGAVVGTAMWYLFPLLVKRP